MAVHEYGRIDAGGQPQWWHELLSCPSCGAPIEVGCMEGAPCHCGRCNTGYRVFGNRVEWAEPSEDTAPAVFKSKLAKCKSYAYILLNPLTNPLSPLALWGSYRVEGYYGRTMADASLAKKWAAHYLKDLSLESGATVLEYGCGRGRHIGLLNQLGFRAVGQDMVTNKWWSRLNSSGFQRLSPSLPLLPWRHGKFDLIMNVMVIHYMPPQSLEEYIAQAYKLLKPGGYLIMTEGNGGGYARNALNREYGGNVHALSFVRALAEKTGFREVDQSYEGFYSPVFPVFVNFIRKQCGPWPLDIADYESWAARVISPEKRGLWVLRLQRPSE